MAPLIMSKLTFDGLAKNHQDALRALGAEVEKLAIAAAATDDQKVAELFGRHGVKVVDLDVAAVDKLAHAGARRPHGSIMRRKRRCRRS